MLSTMITKINLQLNGYPKYQISLIYENKEVLATDTLQSIGYKVRKAFENIRVNKLFRFNN